MDREKIIHLAVDVLGCGCDQSVFNSIDVEENVLLACGVRLSKKIVIGKRLMIYIAPAEDCAPGDVESVLRDGLAERDSCGYNRLRLVIPTGNLNLSDAYIDEFGRCAVKDDRCHVHVVPVEDGV